MEQHKIKELAEEAIITNKELFLISVNCSIENKILVVVDGDKGVPLNECIRISRFIENSFDREVEDFALEVTSPDISEPLKLKRQYLKNFGRILQVKLVDQTELQGTLIEVNDEDIVLEWKAREPKPIGKGKITVKKTQRVLYLDIKEAKVKIIFN